MSGDRMQCEFFLVRYVPDAVKNEFVNIGVVLREAGRPKRRWCDLPGIGRGSDASIPKPTRECWKLWNMKSGSACQAEPQRRR